MLNFTYLKVIRNMKCTLCILYLGFSPILYMTWNIIYGISL